MYSKDELLAKSPEELETIAKALGSNLTAADGVEALASYIIGDFDFDAEKEEKPKRKTRTKTTVSDEEPTEEAPKKKRGRPSKKALEEAAALAAQKAQEELEQITETEASTPEEGTEEIVAPAPKKRRARRTKEEILAAAQAKAEALSLNNQKKLSYSANWNLKKMSTIIILLHPMTLRSQIFSRLTQTLQILKTQKMRL